MFGLVAAGRVPSQFTQIGETEFMCELQSAQSVNHLVVFMTGVQSFPDGYGASVYFCSNINGEQSEWTYLGAICNTKPSAIFKVSQVNRKRASPAVFGGSVGAEGSVQVGIKIEELNVIEGRQAEAAAHVSTQSTLADFGEKMVKNLVNHAESYVVRLPKPDGTGAGDFIPVNALQEWVSNFTRRFKANPYFWRNLHD